MPWGQASTLVPWKRNSWSKFEPHDLSAHKAPIVHQWLLRHPRFVLHFTPVSLPSEKAPEAFAAPRGPVQLTLRYFAEGVLPPPSPVAVLLVPLAAVAGACAAGRDAPGVPPGATSPLGLTATSVALPPVILRRCFFPRVPRA